MDIVSITSGVMLSPKEQVKDVLEYFLQMPLQNDQIEAAAEAARTLLVEIHPWLAGIDFGPMPIQNQETKVKLIKQVYGETVIFPDIFTTDDRPDPAGNEQPTALQA